MQAKSQRKTLNNIYQTYAGLDNSLRHKTTAKMRSAEKLSQTLKPNTKRKMFTQESINELRNSLECNKKKSTKRLGKSKNVTRREKEKDKEKEK